MLVKDVVSALAELQSLVSVDLGVTPGTSGVRRGMEIDQEKLTQFFRDNNYINQEGEQLIAYYDHLQYLVRNLEIVPVSTWSVQPNISDSNRFWREICSEEETSRQTVTWSSRY